jgi:hypothetical protein
MHNPPHLEQIAAEIETIRLPIAHRMADMC